MDTLLQTMFGRMGARVDSVSNVKAAREALQPQELRTSVQRRVRRIKNRLRRRNETFVRQANSSSFLLPI
jgi:hypothetical protein